MLFLVLTFYSTVTCTGPTFIGPHQPASTVVSSGTLQVFRAHPTKDAIRHALSHHYVVQCIGSRQNQQDVATPAAPEPQEQQKSKPTPMTMPLEAMERAFIKTLVEAEDALLSDAETRRKKRRTTGDTEMEDTTTEKETPSTSDAPISTLTEPDDSEMGMNIEVKNLYLLFQTLIIYCVYTRA